MKKLKYLVVSAICLWNFCFNIVWANETDLETYDVAEYVVTATKTLVEKKEIPHNVEIIYKEEIENTGYTTIRDVLKTSTSIIIQNGDGGHGDNFSIRGSTTDDILFLINGRRLVGENTYTNGSVNSKILDRINLSNIERIEIVRGQAGALYGSDAQAGVINIITKKSEKQQTSFGLSTGSRDMSNYYHFDTGRDGKVSAVLDINFSKLRNFDGKANNGFLKGPKQSFTLDADYAMDKSNKFNLFLDYNKENLTYDVDYSSYESYGINDVYKSKQDIERRTAALTFNGNNREKRVYVWNYL